ncbi:methyltransferase domain-containing protein [bacterium]|nr:methyltransferase domain-containing protein [bacterium]
MDARLQRRVQRYGWDKACEHYERTWSAQLRPAQECLLEMAAPGRGERVLDVAAGTGLVSFPAAESVGSTGEVVATDLSQVMVDTLARDAESRGLAHVKAARMDAEQLFFDEASFDVALNGLGLMYVPDPAAALGEMHRVLRPGGRAAAAVWGARAGCGWAEIFPIVDSRVQSEVCPMFFQLGTQDLLERQFVEAGFENVASQRIHVTLDYDSAEMALGAAFAGGPVALAYARFDDATREAAHAEYLASIAAYRNGNGYHIPGEYVVATGRKGVSAGQ